MSIDRPALVLSAEEFAALIQQFGPFKVPTHFAVATSGGPDSLCLALLMAKWAEFHGHKMTALIVDHGLRPESLQEAHFVVQQLVETEIKAEILTWQGIKPTTRIQERARQARYDLLLKWCQAHNYSHLLVAHHAQDQQETAWWRLYRGSDLWGLAGMSAVTQQNGIHICRPLLGIPKQRLLATLTSSGLTAVEDPSNLNEQFSRVRVRNHLSQLPVLPVHALGQLRQAFDHWRSEFIQQHVTVSEYGFLSVNRDAFFTLTQPFQEFLLNHLLKVISNRPFPVRRNDMANLLQGLNANSVKKRTLGGCIIECRSQQLLIMREWHACPADQIGNYLDAHTVCWDGRFILNLPPVATSLTLASMGEKGWTQLCKQDDRDPLALIPHPARLALPALWDGNQLLTLCHFPNLLTPNLAVTKVDFKPTTPLFPMPFKLMA